LFATGKIDLAFHSLDYAIDHGIFPWPDGIPKFSGFVGLKQLFTPQIAVTYGYMKNEIGDAINLIEDSYKKVYDTVSGIVELKVAFRGNLFKIKFDNFEIFNGFMPEIDTIRELSSAEIDGGLFN